MRRYGPTVQVREELRLDILCTVDGEGAAHCVSKRVGICPLCDKMRRYVPTVQVKEELRLNSLGTVDGEVGAQCVINAAV